MKVKVLLFLYFCAICTPLILAWHYFGSPREFVQELGTVLGMLAFAMILSEFALSGRLKSFSKTAGSETIMRFHRIIGWMAVPVDLYTRIQTTLRTSSLPQGRCLSSPLN